MPIEIAEDNDENIEEERRMNKDHSAFYRPWIEPIQHVGWQLGYSIGVHGSLKRDLDMIAAPWIPDAASHTELAWAICRLIRGYEPYMTEARYNPAKKPHGRMAWSIHFFAGNYENIHRYVDLSVLPRAKDLQEQQ